MNGENKKATEERECRPNFINEFQRKHYEACMRARELSRRQPLSAAHMKSLGFHEHRRLASGDIVWVSDDGRFVVSDLTGENVLVDQCGNIRVIDANIQLNTPESDGGGAYRIP